MGKTSFAAGLLAATVLSTSPAMAAGRTVVLGEAPAGSYSCTKVLPGAAVLPPAASITGGTTIVYSGGTVTVPPLSEKVVMSQDEARAAFNSAWTPQVGEGGGPEFATIPLADDGSVWLVAAMNAREHSVQTRCNFLFTEAVPSVVVARAPNGWLPIVNSGIPRPDANNPAIPMVSIPAEGIAYVPSPDPISLSGKQPMAMIAENSFRTRAWEPLYSAVKPIAQKLIPGAGLTYIQGGNNAPATVTPTADGVKVKVPLRICPKLQRFDRCDTDLQELSADVELSGSDQPQVLRVAIAGNTPTKQPAPVVAADESKSLLLFGTWGTEPSVLAGVTPDGGARVPGTAERFGAGSPVTPTIVARGLSTLLRAAAKPGTDADAAAKAATVGAYYPLTADGRVFIARLIVRLDIRGTWIGVVAEDGSVVNLGISPRPGYTLDSADSWVLRGSDNTGWFVGRSDVPDNPATDKGKVEKYLTVRLQALGAVPPGVVPTLTTTEPTTDPKDGSILWSISWWSATGKMKTGTATIKVLAATQGIYRMEISSLR